MSQSSILKLSMMSLFVAPCLWAAPLKLNKCDVTFIATGKPGFLKINGTGAECRGKLDRSAKGFTGELVVTVEKFDTGIPLRDEHMKRDYLEVKTHPEATLNITKFDTDAKGEASDKPFTGTFKFHGYEKPVEGTATATTKGGKSQIKASFPVTLKDFEIKIPTYAGVKVADTVVVTSVIEAEEAAAPAAVVAPAPAAAPTPAATPPAKTPAKAPAKSNGKK